MRTWQGFRLSILRSAERCHKFRSKYILFYVNLIHVKFSAASTAESNTSQFIFSRGSSLFASSESGLRLSVTFDLRNRDGLNFNFASLEILRNPTPLSHFTHMGRSLGKLLLIALGITFLAVRITFPPRYGQLVGERLQERRASKEPHDVLTRDQRPFREAHNVDPEFRILIGVMSPYWASWRRQIVRNAYKRLSKTLPVDIVFVEGDLTVSNKNADRIRQMQRTVIDWENSTYGDIIHLDCDENMNKGKTYDFLKKVGQEFGHKYTHLLKTDDDAFINIPGLMTLVRSDCSARASHP